MTVYWLMFTFPALALLLPGIGSPSLKRISWLLLGIFFTLIIGFRYQVGDDWFMYLNHYSRAYDVPLRDVLYEKDIGYGLLNWISGIIGGEIFLVNFICAAIVVIGLITFSLRQPLPWLSVLIAVPYVLIVFSMGYTRQSAAFGLCLLGLVALTDGRLVKFVFYIFIATLFHKSAILLLPFAVLVSSKNRLWTLLWVGISGLMLAGVVLAEQYESLFEYYVVREKASEGGPVRVAMNALPSIIFLLFSKHLESDPTKGRLWFWMSIFSLMCIPMVGFASTAVDRLALYFIPIQLYVFSRLHRLFNAPVFRSLVVLGIVLGYGFVQWVWLNYAVNAISWLPYQFLWLSST
jgi:hypothetical protein